MTKRLSENDDARAAALGSIVGEIRRLFHRLATVADDAHRDLEVTASQRAVLEALAKEGPQTVPQMARAKEVSRQHIQMLANSLADAELLTALPNPAHQRSSLLDLTAEGRRIFAAIEEREAHILATLASRFRLEDLELTGQTLGAVRSALDPEAPEFAPAANPKKRSKK